jgi:hypothetical protein
MKVENQRTKEKELNGNATVTASCDAASAPRRLMHRVLAPYPPHAPPPPQPTGPPLRVGELCLLRRPDSRSDLVVELRAVDDDVALVHFRGLDRTEIVQLSWLRRPVGTRVTSGDLHLCHWTVIQPAFSKVRRARILS